MEKKVMIIGAGAGQVPLINLCKQEGLHTYVVSPFGPYPGIELADTHINEDIYHVDALVEKGRELGVDYVISDQSDFAVPLVAYIADKLGVPGNKPEVAQTYSYKSKFRAFCEKNNIPSPKAVEIHNADSLPEGLRFPVVVKPADSQGSRGISKVESYTDLKQAVLDAMAYSKKGSVVIEEFFKGREVVCEGFAIDGVYYPVAFGDRNYFNLEGKFIPSQTIFPSSISQEIEKRIIANERLITSILKPGFGTVHSEYLVNEETGEFVVVESALRGGGVYIASDLIPLSVGVELTEILFLAMTGQKEKAIEKLGNRIERASAYICFYLNEGRITSIEGIDKIKSMPHVKKADVENLHIGDNVPFIEHKGMRKGPFIVEANSLSELNRYIHDIQSAFSVNIDGEAGIHWS